MARAEAAQSKLNCFSALFPDLAQDQIDHGLPGPADDTLRVLAEHGRSILGSLEYFGEDATGNHLSNNGRGLYLLGLTLGIVALSAWGASRVVVDTEATLGREVPGSAGCVAAGVGLTRAELRTRDAKVEELDLARDRGELAALLALCQHLRGVGFACLNVGLVEGVEVQDMRGGRGGDPLRRGHATQGGGEMRQDGLRDIAAISAMRRRPHGRKFLFPC